MAQPLFHNVAVRRAFQMAIDVCGLLVTVLHTRDCDRRATQVEPLPSLFYDHAIHPALYDPRAARTLLAQAGWFPDAHGQLTQHGQPFRVRLVTTANNSVRAAVAAHIQQNLQTIGIQVTIAYYPLNTFFGVYTRGGILATGAYDLALFTYANSPEPDDEYAVFSSSQIP